MEMILWVLVIAWIIWLFRGLLYFTLAGAAGTIFFAGIGIIIGLLTILEKAIDSFRWIKNKLIKRKKHGRKRSLYS